MKIRMLAMTGYYQDHHYYNKELKAPDLKPGDLIAHLMSNSFAAKLMAKQGGL
jgi:hypothetical protein